MHIPLKIRFYVGYKSILYRRQSELVLLLLANELLLNSSFMNDKLTEAIEFWMRNNKKYDIFMHCELISLG
jgi:hypothetical protein